MSAVNNHFFALERKFDAFTMRERALMCVGSVVVVFLVFDLLFFSSINKEKEMHAATIESSKSAIELSTNEEKVLSQSLLNDPNTNKRREINDLKDQIKAIDEEMFSMSSELILAEHFPRLLSSMLNKQTGIKIISLVMAPTEELLLPLAEPIASEEVVSDVPATAGEPNTVIAQPRLYKHSVTFKLESTFFELIDYIELIESMEWKIYWSELNYVVKDYPKAEIEITAYSISTSRGNFDK